MTTKEQREIIEAYERGEEIEMKTSSKNEWFIIKLENDGFTYQFNFFNNIYRIKPKRWRSEKGKRYYSLNPALVVVLCEEEYDSIDTDRFNAGNYFRTDEIAKKAKELLTETLTKFHEEND